MSKIEESYEEQVRKEFESTQPKEEVKETVASDLGKVNVNQTYEDPEINRIKSSMDYINIPLENLPSQGRFYPEQESLSVPQGLVKSESFQLSMRKTLKTSGIR